MTEKLRVIELFSGIGAQAMALEQLGIPFETMCCEIDPKAYKSYCAIHGDTPNLGDITKIEHLPECDLLTYSFPCQDLSNAGLQKGFDEGSGTRSSLLWEVKRLLLDMRERGCPLPMTLVMENVKALVFKKNMPGFQKWIDFLTSIGYASEWKVMNAKDYGVPQNRERVFMVSRLDGKHFIFPEPHPDGRVLKDVLEDDVPEEYYLSQEKIAHYEQHRIRQEENGRGFGWKPTDGSQQAHALTGNQTRHTQNFIRDDGSRMTPIMAGNLNLPTAFGQANDVHSIDGSAPTITTRHVGIGQPKIEVASGEILSGEMTDTRFVQQKRVYSPDGMAPTILSRDWKRPKKIEVAGSLGDGYISNNKVVSTKGIAPTHRADAHGNNIMIEEEHNERCDHRWHKIRRRNQRQSRSQDRLRTSIRWIGRTHVATDKRVETEILVHREPKSRITHDVVHEGPPKIHGLLLSIRGHAHETD